MTDIEHTVERIEKKLDIVAEDVNELKRFQVKQETINKGMVLTLRFFGVAMMVLSIGEIILQRGIFK